MKKTFFASILSISIFLLLGLTSVSAVIDGSNTAPIDGSNTNSSPKSVNVSIQIDNPFKCGNDCTIFRLAEMIVNNIILPLGGVLAVLAFIYSGFKYVMARGNESAIQEAHRALLYTSIGTAILLGAWVFTQVIENTINQLKS